MHREKLFDREQFAAARIVQSYLIREAEQLGIHTIDNAYIYPQPA